MFLIRITMQKALFYKILEGRKVQCQTCHHQCTIAPNGFGICGVRQNIDGDLFLLVYGKAAATDICPIEKKGLTHFLPGTKTFSFGTFGCNFKCQHCSNWDLSQEFIVDDVNDLCQDMPPKKIADYCKQKKIPSITYNFNEPTVYVEYAADVMKEARKAGIKNVLVTNGYMTRNAMSAMTPFLDAISFEFKSMSDEFYQKTFGARLKPVLDNIDNFDRTQIWMEITTSIMPGKNDDVEQLGEMARFIRGFSANIPWHLSLAQPNYKVKKFKKLDVEVFKKAYHIAKEVGLNYAYIENIPQGGMEDTHCPRCNFLIASRNRSFVVKRFDKSGKCPECEFKMPGVWTQ